MEVRDLETAQHEAAHVVVGCALGLRLRLATVGASWDRKKGKRPKPLEGFADFFERRGDGTAQAIMLAAGVAWDRVMRWPAWRSAVDRRLARQLCSGRRGYEALVSAATALLAGLRAEHERVTRALLARDITGADLAALCRGEDID